MLHHAAWWLGLHLPAVFFCSHLLSVSAVTWATEIPEKKHLSLTLLCLLVRLFSVKYLKWFLLVFLKAMHNIRPAESAKYGVLTANVFAEFECTTGHRGIGTRRNKSGSGSPEKVGSLFISCLGRCWALIGFLWQKKKEGYMLYWFIYVVFVFNRPLRNLELKNTGSQTSNS